MARLPLACPPLDEMLHGGVESGAITEFFGEAGAGKTNACLQLARNAALAGRKTVFVDTEGVSMERLAQMSGAHYEKVREHILFFEPFSWAEQESIVDKAARLAAGAPEIGLIVMDSATLLYRVNLGTGDDQGARRALGAQLHRLAAVARKRGLPVVITNQVFTNLETETFEPLGGQMLRHIAKAVVRLEKTADGQRMATLLKHRAAAEGSTARFRITDAGLVGDEAPAPLVAIWDEVPGKATDAPS